MITLKEIAEICGVSVMTVSNVVNGKSKVSKETQEKILAVVKEKGYTPNYVAKGLRTKKTNTIALIAEDISQFTTPLIIEGVVAHCEQAGYRVVMQNLRLYARWSDTWYDQDKAFHSVLDPAIKEVEAVHADGMIYIAGHAREINCFDHLDIPVVMAYAYSNSKKVPSVVVDDEVSAYQVVKYLISKNHKRIGVIAGRIDNLHTKFRLEGYKRALAEANIEFDPELIYYTSWERENGYGGAKELLDKNITAIFSMSDQMSGGIYDYCTENNIVVGKDISIASFDNTEFSEYMTPKLTTTWLPLPQIGVSAAQILLDMINKSNEYNNLSEPFIQKIPCFFQERDSVRGRS